MLVRQERADLEAGPQRAEAELQPLVHFVEGLHLHAVFPVAKRRLPRGRERFPSARDRRRVEAGLLAKEPPALHPHAAGLPAHRFLTEHHAVDPGEVVSKLLLDAEPESVPPGGVEEHLRG